MYYMEYKKMQFIFSCESYINGNMGEPHTEGKIVINDNIIEQVTDFKYLGYCISEFKSDVEDKLRAYNKINGAIR